MGYEEMKVANVKGGGGPEFAFEADINLDGAGESDWYLIPDDIMGLSVTVKSTAQAKAQTTTDPISIVKSGSGITPVDWPAGLVSTATQDHAKPVTAIRLSQTGAGASKMTVRCQ